MKTKKKIAFLGTIITLPLVAESVIISNTHKNYKSNQHSEMHNKKIK